MVSFPSFSALTDPQQLANTSVFSQIANSFSQYVVAPLNAFGLGGYIFDIEGEAITHLENEITDHYIEDNTTVQDHIAVKPVRVVLRNYVGEIVYRRDNTTNTPLQQLTQKLTVLNSYLPSLTAGAQQAAKLLVNSQSLPDSQTLNQFSNGDISGLVDNAVNIYGLAQNLLPPVTKQQQAYQYFKSLATQKILFSVQTPHEFLSNMAIESVMAIQTADSRYISDFTITLKQMRFANTQFVGIVPQSQGATSVQSQTPQNNSNVQGLTVSNYIDAPTLYSSYK
jgi:hypothetical protein